MEQSQGRNTSVQDVGTPTTQPTPFPRAPQPPMQATLQPQPATPVASASANIPPSPQPPVPAPAAPTPPVTPPPSSTPASGPTRPPITPKPKRHVSPVFKRVAWAILALFILGAIGFIILRIQEESQANSERQSQEVDPSSRFGTLQLPLGELAQLGNLTLDGNRTLSVNGQLRVNNSLVLSPTGQPTNAVAGQIFYDQTDNLLSYYNGSEFVDVPGSENTVTNLGGLTGVINLGGGLTAAAGTLNNTGVLSLQGQTGNVTLTSGGGIAIDGTTLTNTGVLSLGGQTGAIGVGTGLSITNGTLNNTGVVDVVAGTPNLVISNSNGTITISDTGGGGGTVSSPGGTAGRIAKFTGVQTIADSLLSETGTTVTVHGDLSVTGALTLGTPLGVAQGGTGTNSLANNGVIVGQGTGALISVAAGGVGQCLVSTAGAPAFQACPGSGGVASLNGLTGALTVANASAAGSTITIDDASTVSKGIAQFNSTNFSVTSGVVNTIQDISVTASPTFGQLTLTGDLAVNGGDITSTGALNVTPTGTLTLGSVNQQALLQGNANTQITATGGGFSTTVGFAGVASGNVVYNFDRSATAGTYTICSTAGNCAGVGGGVTTPGGTTNRLSKFTSAQGIGDSTITDDGSNVTTSVDMVIQGGDVTVGVANTQTGSMRFAHSGSGFFGMITQGALTGNRTYTLPDASGTFCLTSGNCSGSGSANTLQAAYDAGNTITTTDGRNIVFTLSDLATDPNFLVNLECDTSCGANGRFAVQTDGVDVFTVSPPNGAVAFQNSTNTANAFQVKNAAGANMFGIDTTNNTFLFGEDLSNKHVQINLSGNDGIVDIGATGGNLHFVLRQLSNGAAKINTDSDLIVQRTTNSVSAFQVQNASGGVAALSVDTTNILTRLSGAGSDASATSGTGALQIGADAGANLAFDDNEIVARNNGSMSTLFLQNGGGGMTVGANLVNFQNATNSNNALTVRNAAGNSVANFDTTEGELELGTGSTLNGKLLFRNSTTNFVQVLVASGATAHRSITLPDEDGTICLRNSTNCGFAASSGSSSYIHNSATLQQNANIAIESVNDGSRTLYLRNRATQTADIMRVEQNNGAHVFSIDTFGGLKHSGQANFESYTGIGIPGAATTGVALRVYAPTASDIGLQVNGNLSQTGDLMQLNSINGRTLKYSAAGTLQVTGGNVQSANLFEVRDNSSNMLASFGPTGSIIFQNATDSTNAFRVNNAAGGYVFNVDTANSKVGIGFLEFEVYDGIGGSIDTFFANASIGIGTARADQIDIGRSGATTTVVGNFVQNTGTINMTANGTSSIATTSGTLTLQSVNGSNNIVINGSSNAMTLNTGAAGTITVGSSNTTTVNIGALTNNARTVNIGVGTGGSQAQTVNIGSQGGTSTTTIQGGSGATAIAMTTATNGSINATTTGTGMINLNTANSVQVRTTTDSTVALNVKSSLNNNAFTVDTLNNRVGISLGGNVTPTLSSRGVEIGGAIRLSGGPSYMDTYVTPLGANIQTTINIPNYNPGAFNQLVAMGLPSTADATSRVITLLDARTTAHQPTLAILSPNEAEYMGMSWEGTNTGAYLKASAGRNWVIRSDTTDLAVFEATTQQNGVGVNGNASAAWHISSTIVGNDLLKVTDGAINVLNVADEGATTFRNSTNSTNAFQIQNATGQQLMNIDSTNSLFTILGNNSGHLSPFSTNTNNLTGNREGGTAVTVNGYIYHIGGCSSGSATNTVMYARANADGSTGTWSTTTNLPDVNCNGAAAAYNGYIYVSGGTGANSDTVYYGKVNADGTVTSWNTQLAAIPQPLRDHAMIGYSGKMYFIGGRNANTFTVLQTVYSGNINSDGSLGTITENGTNWLATDALGPGVAIANGYLYVLGGATANQIIYGKVNADGTLGTRNVDTDTLSSDRTYSAFGVMNGYLYAVGGNGSAPVNTVSYAQLNNDGSTGAWTNDTTTLPAVRSTAGSVVLNNYIYVIGGWNGTSETNTVYYASTTRLKVGASLDLVGLSGENLTEGGSGGQLTAGNTFVSGTLNVTGEAILNNSTRIAKNLTVGGSTTLNGSLFLSPTFNSTSILIVQNLAGSNIFAVDTSNSRIQIGNATADTSGVLLVLDGKSDAGDPTGIQGAMYYNEALAAFRCYQAGAWKNCDDPRSLNWGYRLEEDFLGEGATAPDIGTHGWSDVLNGAGTFSGKIAADSYKRPGQFQLATGTTSTGFVDLYLGEKWNTNEQFILGGGELIEFSINIANLSTATEEYVLHLGMCDEDGPQDCMDGAYFEYDRLTSANWRYAVANNNARTKNSSSKAVATGWVNFRILVTGNGTSATSAQFFVRNDGESTWTSLGTINTNLPANNRGMSPTFDITKTAGTTSRSIKVDYFNLYNSLGGAGR